ncbi:MAG TPA: type II toxin-antitoxin system RelE/ParE family toxin [Xanthobacteraceae bacterium]|jgi:plasmid stabilization system protein ParE
MKVRYTPRARGDIEEIFRCLEARSSAGARNVLAAIYAGVEFIAEHPEASQRADDPVRVKIVRRYRYKIFYSIDGDTIEILHVRHTSRRRWRGE